MSSTHIAKVAPADHSRTAFRLGLAAGLAVLLLTLLGDAAPVPSCGTLASGHLPILAFELARSAADLHAVFGTSEPCRSTMIASMEQSIRIDTLLYIPAYGAFMALVFLGWRARATRLANAGVYVTLAAVLFDYLENWCLMKLLPQLDTASVWFTLLPWITGVKWLGLGLTAALAGLMFLRSAGSRLWRLPAALICITTLLFTLLAMVLPATFGMRMIEAVAASWLVYLIAAARGAFTLQRE